MYCIGLPVWDFKIMGSTPFSHKLFSLSAETVTFSPIHPSKIYWFSNVCVKTSRRGPMITTLWWSKGMISSQPLTKSRSLRATSKCFKQPLRSSLKKKRITMRLLLISLKLSSVERSFSLMLSLVNYQPINSNRRDKHRRFSSRSNQVKIAA